MPKGLTVRSIEALRSASNRREIPDGHLPGLYLIVQPTGARSWAVRYRHSGRPRKYTLGGFPTIDLGTARRMARQALTAVAEGRDPGDERKETRRAGERATQCRRDTVDAVAGAFVDRYAKANTREASWRETERLLKKDVLPAWQGRSVHEIARRDVIDLLDAITDRGAPVVANRVLAAIRRMFGWAVERGILETSPCAGLKAPAAERSRDRVLSDQEIKLLWRACEEIGWPFGPLVQLLLLTGQRRDEVAELRWYETDFDGRLWTIPRERTKNDLAHEVPLSAAAVAVLQGIPKVGDGPGYVFSTSGERSVTGFSRAKARLDARMRNVSEGERLTVDWRLHDLRRTMASGMARLGINLPIIEKVLNHTSGSFAGVVGVYQRHSFADEKRIALEHWGRFVSGIAADQTDRKVVSLRR
ncbi:MAG TPA: integrase arm-type DNA-binding domain-containing protein [Nitrospiraceae bacterium]